MDSSIIIISIVCLAIFTSAIVTFVHKKPSFNVIVKKLKNSCYDLFLIAEKKDLVNEDKMEWCIQQLLKKLPDLKLNIDEDTTRMVAQYVYDLYKANAERYLKD